MVPASQRRRRTPRSVFPLALAVAAAATAHLAGQGPLVPGANVNMVRGTAFLGGDPYLQRQNEPSLAISTRNPCHLLAGANDYRTVDFPDPTPLPNEDAPPPAAPVQNPRDAWLGVFTSTDCGATWRSTLLPGHPFDTSSVGLASPNRGFTAAADPVVRAGTNGLFFYAGLVFDRADNSRSQIFVARFIDNNNRERGETIEYVDAAAVDAGDPDVFVDKPWVAVDQPRAGALMCDINGQRFPAGRVYVAWSRFEGSGARVMLSRSLDCGRTWQSQALSDTSVTNQGASIAIAPHDGTVYVAWRQFARQGSPATIQIAASRNGGQTFTRATVASPINAFDQTKLENRRFRTNTLPTVAADHLGRVYVAWAERGYARATGRTNPQTGDARIVLAVSSNFGQTFAARYPIDDTAVDADGLPRFGHQVMPSLTFAAGKLQVVFYDFSDDLANVFNQFVDENEGEPIPGTNLRRRHTVDVRAAHAEPGAQPVFVPVLITPQGTSPRLSQYRTIVDPDGTVRQVQFNPPNLPLFVAGTIPFIGDYIDVAGLSFVPFQGGWRHNNSNTSGPRFDGAFPSTPVFHAVWTDHRDVKAPPDGDWTLYRPPGDPFWKMPGSECVPDRAGMRNANIYTARLTNGLYAGSPGNTKPLGYQRNPDTGAVLIDPTTGRPIHIQRSFVVFLQNSLPVTKKYLLRIVNQPGAVPGDRASFLRAPAPPFSNADLASAPYIWLVASVPPLSTISRTVFVTAANEKAMVRIDVLEVAAAQAQAIGTDPRLAPLPAANGLRATVLLNPDPTNPTIIDPDFVSPDVPVLAEETHDPEIFDPVVTTIGDVRNNAIELRNPDEANPDEANPDEANIDEETPDEANPDEANPDEANPDEANPDEANPDEANIALRNTALPDGLTNTHVVDVQWKVRNRGNTTTSFRFSPTFSGDRADKHFQLLVTKRYYVPAVDGITCELGVRRTNQVLVNVPAFNPRNPDEANPDEANPDEANPDEANPDEANPDEANPDEANATFFLAPGETVTATLRIYDVSTPVPPAPPQLAAFEETASAVVESQAVNTGEAAPPRDVAGADLVPAAAVASPANAAPGATVQVAWTLANRGTEPTEAASFRTRFLFSTDRDISEGDTELAVVTFNGIVPADDPSTPDVNEGELPQTTSLTLPAGAASPTRFILLVTDSANDVPEADEVNNAAAAPLGGANALAFAVQPSAVTQGFRMAPPIRVAITDAAGLPAPPAAVPLVRLSIASGPQGASLGGTLTLPNVDGSATFGDITLPVPGTYTLAATGVGFEGPVFAAPAVSAPFTVEADDPPLAVTDSYSVAANGVLTVTAATGVIANDVDELRIPGPGAPPPGRVLAATVVQNVARGTLAFDASGGFTYTPQASFDGVDFFTYRLNDGVSFGNTVAVRISVGSGEGNIAPVTRPLSITVAEDSGQRTIDIAANSLDADGDPIAVTQAAALHGSAVPSGGNILYRPDLNYFGADTITYVISDGQGGTAEGSVAVTITAVNDNPIARDDGPFTVTPDATTPSVFSVLDNDEDGPDGPEDLVVVGVGGASHGAVTFGAADVRYTPHRGYTGPDTFGYEISDGRGGRAVAMVRVSVGEANHTPVALNDTATLDEDTSADIDVLANDSDPDSDDISVSSFTQAANGTVSAGPGGTLRYQPNAHFHGSDTFTYTITDGQHSDLARVNVTVISVNDTPIAVDDQATTLRDTSIDIDVLANDIDVERCLGCTPLQRGGEWVFFTSDRAAPGSNHYHLYAIRPDGSDLVQLTTGAVVDASSHLHRDGRTLLFGRTVDGVSEIWRLDVATGHTARLIGRPDLPGDVFYPVLSPDGQRLAFTQQNGSSYDIWVSPYPPAPGGFRRVTPDDGLARVFPSWASNDTVLFQIDAAGDPGPSIRAVNVDSLVETVVIPSRGGEWYPSVSPDGSLLMWNSERHSPSGDIFVAPWRGAALIPDHEHRRITAASGWNLMDWSPDGHRIVAETFPVAGQLMIMNSDGSDLRPLPSSPTGSFAPWWATVVRAPLPPGSDGQPLQVVAIPTVSHGGALVLPSGRVRFTPEAGFTGAATFTYVVSDGEDTDTATVSVAVIGPNSPPTATDDLVQTNEDTPLVVDVALNDTDPDEDPLAIDAIGGAQHGTVEHSTAEPTRVRYVPHANFNGSDAFTYTIRDGRGYTDTATVHVTVNAVNDEPTSLAALPDRVVDVGAPDTVVDLTAFFTDADIATNGDALTFTIAENTNSAVVNATIEGHTLTLDYGSPGSARVGVRATDTQTASFTDAFFVTVGATENQAPVANPDSASTLTGTPVTINVLANDVDPDRDTGGARVVASIPFDPPGTIGNNPSATGPLAAVGEHLYVATGQGVSVIDAAAGAVVALIDTVAFGGPIRRAIDSAGLVYFATNSNAIFAIDARPASATFNQVVFSTTLGGSRINDLVIDSARGRLYAISETLAQMGATTTPGHSRIVVIDTNLASGSYGQTIRVVPFNNTTGASLAVNPANGDVYAGTTGANSGVHWLDDESFVLTPITGVLPVLELIVDVAAGRAYGLSSGGQVLAFNLATRTLIAGSQFTVPGLATPNAVQTFRHLAADSNTGRVWVRSNGGAGLPGFVFALQPGGAPAFWSVLAQIPVGRDSSGDDLVIDSGGRRVITGSGVDHRVSFINADTNALEAVGQTRRTPADLELLTVGPGRRVYADMLNAVAPFTIAPVSSLPEVVVGGETGNIVVNPNTHQAFVGFNDAQARILAFDRDGLVGEVPTAGFNNAGRWLFVGRGVAANQVYALNTDSDDSGSMDPIPGVLAVINDAGVAINVFDVGNGPFGGTVNQTSGRVHIPAAGRAGQPGGVTVVDPAAETAAQVNISGLFTANLGRNIGVVEALGKAYVQVAAVDTNGSALAVYTEAGLTASRLPVSLGVTNVHLIAVNQTTRRVYVGTVAGATNRIRVIDANTDSLVTTLDLGSQSTTITSQAYIAIDEARGRIYIADFEDDTLHVVDAVTHALLRTLNVGDGPTAVAINQLSNRIYVGSTLDNRLTFVDGETMTVRGGLDLPMAPTFLDVDPATNRIYASGGRSLLTGGSGAMVIADDSAFFTHPLTIASVGDSTGGTVLVNADQTITFAPSVTAGVNGQFSYTVSDGELESPPAVVSVFIRPAMTISTASLPNGAVGGAYNVVLQTANANGIVRWSATGNVPTGLTLSSAGVLSGTLASQGRFTFTVRAQDQSSPPQVATRTYTVNIGPLTIPAITLPIGLVGEPYSFTFVAAGATGPTTWSLASGALPNGLTLNESGVVTGTPTDVASYPFSVRVTDGAGQVAVGAFSILIDGNPTLIDPAPPSEVHAFYGFAPFRIGRQPVVLDLLEGTLPSGLSILPSGPITGTPQQSGQFPLRLRITDARGRQTEGDVLLSSAAPDQTLGSGGAGATTQAFGPTRRLAQTFTAGATGSLVAVRSTQLVCSPGDRLTVELRRVTGASAAPDESGPALATGISLLNGLPTSLIQLDPFVPFTAGQRFAIVWQTSGACEFRNVTVASTGYLFGDAWESQGGGPWQRIAGAGDLSAITVIQPPALHYLTEGGYSSPAAVRLPNGDVLITSANGGNADVLTPSTGAIRRTAGNLLQRRTDYSATLLDDGRVLIAGGQVNVNGVVTYLSQAEVYQNDTFTQVGSLISPRDRHAAVKLADGRVLIIGGWDGTTQLRSMEIFDPETNAFSAAGQTIVGRADPVATVLECPSSLPSCSFGGKILITGNVSSPPGELYDPATGTTTALPGSTLVTRGFRHTATQLLDGRVLLAGGGGSNHVSLGAEVLNVATGASTAVTGSDALRLERHAARRMPDGTVLIAGGRAGDQFETDHRVAVLRFDPATMSVRGAGQLQAYRSDPAVLLMPDGRVLYVGGSSPGGSTLTGRSYEYFDPDPEANVGFTTVVLPNGQRAVEYPTTTLQAGGGTPPYTFTLVSGDLPPGLTFAAGVIAGTPTAAADGAYTFIARVSDASAEQRHASMAFTIRVNGLAITTGTLPGGSIGVPYSAQIQSAGGTPPYTYAVTSNSPPSGLTVNADGSITGTPAVMTTPNFNFRVRVTDASGQVAFRWLFISIADPPVLLASLPPALLHDTYSAAPYTGGTGPFTLTVVSGVLPRGLSASGGSLTGVLQATGDFPIRLRVTDGSGRIDEGDFTLRAMARDQVISLTVGGSTQPFGPARRIAQTFVVGATGVLSGVRFATNVCAAGVATVEVRRVIGSNIGTPEESGPPLATGTIGPTFVAELSPVVPFSIGDRVAIVLSSTGSCEIRSVTSIATVYALGDALESTGGGPWQRITGAADLPIETLIHSTRLAYLTQRYLSRHNVATLPNGEILVGGGNGTADIFTPSTGISRRTANNMAFARPGHSLTPLDDGRVMVAGGGFGNTVVEMFANGQFQNQGSILHGRLDHSATKLPDGRVVLAGGQLQVGREPTIEIFDPATNTSSEAGVLINPRDEHYAVLLVCPASNPGCAWGGRILFAGGDTNNNSVNRAEVYNPATQTSAPTAGAMLVARARGSVTLLADGRVLFIGGSSALPTAEIFDPATGTFAAASNSSLLARFNHTATPMADGAVLVAGGTAAGPTGAFEDRAETLRFDPATSTITGAGLLQANRRFLTASELADGRLLFIAGSSSTNIGDRSAEYLDPDSPDNLFITTVTLPNGQRNVAYAPTSLQAGGGVAPYTFQVVSGTVPPGLTFTNGLIAGTPDGTAGGTYRFVVEVTDSSPVPLRARAPFSITINLIQITTTVLPAASVGQPYSQQLQATGAPPFTWTLTSGSLPAGLALGEAGLISGTPTTVQNLAFTVRVEDAAGQFATRTFSINVSGPLQLLTPPIAFLQQFYNRGLAAGGTLPYTLTLLDGTLPRGLAIGAGATISGTPQVAGSFPLTLRLTDGAGRVETRSVVFDSTVQDQFISAAGGGGTTQTFGPARRLAQIFTAGADGHLVTVRSFNLFCASNGQWTVEVRRVVGSDRAVPDESGPPLATGTGGTDPSFPVMLDARPFFRLGERFAVVANTAGACEFRNVPPLSLSFAYPFGHALESAGGGPWARIENGMDLPMHTLIAPVGVHYLTQGSYFAQAASELPNGDVLVTSGAHTGEVITPSTGLSRRPSPGWSPNRWEHTSTALDDGRVLIVGGYHFPDSSTTEYSARAETFNGSTFTQVGSLATGRAYHTATKLPDGRVVIAGGFTGTGFVETVEIFNPATNSFASGGTMAQPRFYHSATLLRCATPAPCAWDGKILFAGGGSGTLAGEVYDPLTGTSTPTGNMAVSRSYRHRATRLGNGRVLLIGGQPSHIGAELFDPATGTFTAVPDSEALALTGAALTTLADGSALVSGGQAYVVEEDGVQEFNPVLFRFDPVTSSFRGAGTIRTHRNEVAAAALSDGRVALIGGSTIFSAVNGLSFELYDPAAPAVVITTTSLPSGQRNSPYPATTIEAAGGTAPYTFQVLSGSLPPGLTFANGLISGTPDGTAGGRYSFVVQVTDSSPLPLTGTMVLRIRIGSLSIDTTVLPTATVGVPYAAELTATGFPPYRWALVDGTLPPGLTLHADGVIDGTPTSPNFWSFYVQAEDSVGQIRQGSSGISVVNGADSDGDGVTDLLDLCAATPAGALVDSAGCSASQYPAMENPCAVNSVFNEFGSTVSSDGLTIVFQSTRDGGTSRIFSASRSATTDCFGAASQVANVNAGGGVSDEDPEFSGDELTLFLNSNRASAPHANVFAATRGHVQGAFAAPSQVIPGVAGFASFSPSISADGLTIYFASDRPGGAGGSDIWMASRASTVDPFGAPVRVLGLNSPHDERAPEISRDGLMLYFSSDRPGGQGDHDIYVARRTSTMTSFGPPVNFVALNSPAEDTKPNLSADGRDVYFQSSRTGGAGGADIWLARGVPSAMITQTASATDVPRAIPDNGVTVSTLAFPASGTIVDMRLFFRFTHACERNLRITLRHPNGRFAIVMDRGNETCTGEPATFTSDNTMLRSVFAGSQALANWRLEVQDLETGFVGTLDAWTLLLVVRP